jgi:acyl-CoA synthetase (AMP-forming)/AMP-acid ligase II
MNGLTSPSVVFQGTCWSSAELTGIAGGWREALDETLDPRPRCVAMAMDNHPLSVALFFALSCFDAPLVLLPPDLRPWRSSPPLPRDTRLVLLERQRGLEDEAHALGITVSVVPDAPSPRAAPRFLTMPGVVLFTSGSTGGPRPVFRRTAGLLATARALVDTLGLAPGSGVVTSLPLARAFGLHHGLIASAIVEGSLALLDRFEPHALLRLFATGQYRYWSGMPMMADVLSRCPLSGPPAAPPLCVVGARVSADLARRFRARFGVPLRQAYGTTETGGIAVDAMPAARVRSATVGRPMNGVAVRIGDDPRAPLPVGELGRVWVSAPASLMDGYGFPPDLERPETVDGWWATPDLGALDADGCLGISGRRDEAFRTSAGHLVSPASVAAALERYPGVVDTAVVPLAAPGGPVLGVLVESAAPLSAGDLRRHLGRSLPAWSQPRAVQSTCALPRLASGKVDRQACIAILEQGLGGERVRP